MEYLQTHFLREQLRPADVLLGRGLFCMKYPGNIRFRAYIQERVARYMSGTRRCTKNTITMEVLELVTRNGGRFLRQLTIPEKTAFGYSIWMELWVEVPSSVAETKVKQAFRDNSTSEQIAASAEASKANTDAPTPSFATGTTQQHACGDRTLEQASSSEACSTTARESSTGRNSSSQYTTTGGKLALLELLRVRGFVSLAGSAVSGATLGIPTQEELVQMTETELAWFTLGFLVSDIDSQVISASHSVSANQMPTHIPRTATNSRSLSDAFLAASKTTIQTPIDPVDSLQTTSPLPLTRLSEVELVWQIVDHLFPVLTGINSIQMSPSHTLEGLLIDRELQRLFREVQRRVAGRNAARIISRLQRSNEQSIPLAASMTSEVAVGHRQEVDPSRLLALSLIATTEFQQIGIDHTIATVERGVVDRDGEGEEQDRKPAAKSTKKRSSRAQD